MMTQPQPGHPPGTEHARAFYEGWPFVRQAVCLYSRGIAWKGATLYGFAQGADKATTLLDISQDALLALTPDWIIDGSVRVAVGEGSPPSLMPASNDQPAFALTTLPQSPFDSPGQTLLWPACRHHHDLLEMSDLLLRGPNPHAQSLLNLLMDDVHRSLFLPAWAFDPQQAATADRTAVQLGLHGYRLMVADWRQRLLWSLRGALKDWLAERFPDTSHHECAWNAEWFPQDAFGGWEGLYWAFRECRLELTTFGREFAASLRELVDTRMISRQRLQGWNELGL